MALSQQKKILPLILFQYIRKLQSSFISRLVLLQKQPVSNIKVGHYDLLCEGIQILVGFFKKKQQVLLIKSLTRVRDNTRISKLLVTETKDINAGTKRTQISSNLAGYEESPFKRVIPLTLRDLLQENYQNYQQKAKPRQQSRINILLSKVKQVNQHSKENYIISDRLQTQNSKLSDKGNLLARKLIVKANHNRNGSHADWQTKSIKNYYQNKSVTDLSSRRQTILDKFNQIQQSLSKLKIAEQAEYTTQMSPQLIRDIQNMKKQLQNRRPVHIE